ncbi:hypothetical protein FRB94_008281 [Tulasnella sp. JGI-2019a]|nr:hypothetical protein FRB94_008281 [Tulasnella sp. JGI-2019a]KAG9004917.1 hypothetical protein FRB93_010096 [Tulasnella sp. JGI-2019a]KAG9027631.1 hypothetical protein FRB95_007565 [Tulasnella sp. JGI-2019a]
MEYSDIRELCERYPRQAGSFFQAYSDLKFSQKWLDIEAVDLAKARRLVIKGRKDANEPLRIVAPCSLGESLSIQWLNAIFEEVSPSPMEIYLGITSDDSSIVYYRLSKGMVKPPL